MRRRAVLAVAAAALVAAGCSSGGDGARPLDGAGTTDASASAVASAVTTTAGATVPAAPTTGRAVASSAPAATTTEPAGAYRDAVLAAGPVAYWPLDELAPGPATDAGPSGLGASYAGRIAFGEPPAVRGGGTSIRLDGTGGHLAVGGAASAAGQALAVTPELTVELWYRPAAVPTGTVGQLARWRWFGWELQVFDGRLAAGLWLPPTGGAAAGGTTGTPVSLAGPALREGAWHHVALTKDVTMARLYVDGAVVAEAAAPGPILYLAVDPALDCCGSGGGVAFGRDGDVTTDAAHFLTGGLDEVAVYARALTSAELAAHASFARP